MSEPTKILFVCTGNSCRSQMAEGITHHLGSDSIEARSAGIESHGVDPGAVGIMAEIGVDISEQESSILSDEMLEWADIVITLCSDADRNCPLLPPGTRKIHRPFPDPRKATGTGAEITAVYRKVRNEILLYVKDLIDHHIQ